MTQMIRPFEISVSDAALDDLMSRLSRVWWPSPLSDDSRDDGTSLIFLRRLVDRWRSGFNWRAEEARLNRLPQFIADVHGVPIHFLHQRGAGPRAMPLIMTHGWPGSFLEMEQILPLLTNPADHGGDAADAFDVIVPSLPGFGFSPAPQAAGTNSRRISTLWHDLMRQLGYDRFGAQGGDIGAGVSAWLGLLAPEAVIGLHLNYIPGGFRPALTEQAQITAEEQLSSIPRRSGQQRKEPMQPSTARNRRRSPLL